jgi:hypothetical protein
MAKRVGCSRNKAQRRCPPWRLGCDYANPKETRRHEQSGQRTTRTGPILADPGRCAMFHTVASCLLALPSSASCCWTNPYLEHLTASHYKRRTNSGRGTRGHEEYPEKCASRRGWRLAQYLPACYLDARFTAQVK